LRCWRLSDEDVIGGDEEEEEEEVAEEAEAIDSDVDILGDGGRSHPKGVSGVNHNDVTTTQRERMKGGAVPELC
jgi:hypothetical protein